MLDLISDLPDKTIHDKSTALPRGKLSFSIPLLTPMAPAVQQCAAHGGGRAEGLCHGVQPLSPARHLRLLVPGRLQALVLFSYWSPGRFHQPLNAIFLPG